MEKFSEIINSNTPTLADFYAEWCAPCRNMKPILKELKQQMGEKVRIIKIDVEKNSSLSQALEIRSVPTLILYRNGNIVWRASGLRSAEELKEIIEKFQPQ